MIKKHLLDGLLATLSPLSSFLAHCITLGDLEHAEPAADLSVPLMPGHTQAREGIRAIQIENVHFFQVVDNVALIVHMRFRRIISVRNETLETGNQESKGSFRAFLLAESGQRERRFLFTRLVRPLL